MERELKMIVKYEYTIEQAITDNIIADYKIHIYYLQLNNINKVIDISSKTKKLALVTEKVAYDYYTQQFEKFKYAAQFNPALHTIKQKYAGLRAQLIYNLPSKLQIAKQLADSQDKLIVFTQSKLMADSICDSYHSKNKDTDNLSKFINSEIDKLATVNMVSMGVTIPNLKKALCVQLQSNDEIAIQKVARILNPDDDRVGFIQILAVRDTVDQLWVNNALLGLREDKITWSDWE